MKVVIIFIACLTFREAFAVRQVTFDSFLYSPEDSDLIDYGTLKIWKGKNKKTLTLNGNFTIKRILGNEKLVTFEILSGNGLLLRKNTYAFCEFIRIEKMIWPNLVKVSSMPQDNPCPFPVVTILKITILFVGFNKFLFLGQLHNQKVCFKRVQISR